MCPAFAGQSLESRLAAQRRVRRTIVMTLKYTPIQADLVHAARAWEGQHWAMARYIVAATLLCVGAFSLYVGMVWWAVAFCFFGVLEAFNLLPAAVLRALIEFRSNPKFREEHELTLSKEGLHFRTATIDSSVKWTHYSQVLETPKVFILVYGKRMFSVLPKRAFGGEKQVQEARELLSSAIAPPRNVA